MWNTKYHFLWWMIVVLQCSSISLLTLTMACRQTTFLSSWLFWWPRFSRTCCSLFQWTTAVLSQACLWAELVATVQAKLVHNSLATGMTFWLAHSRWCLLLAFRSLHTHLAISTHVHTTLNNNKQGPSYTIYYSFFDMNIKVVCRLMHVCHFIIFVRKKKPPCNNIKKKTIIYLHYNCNGNMETLIHTSFYWLQFQINQA